LIGDLWDSVAEAPEAIGLTDARKAQLDKRLDARRKDPTAGSPPGLSFARESPNVKKTEEWKWAQYRPLP